MPYINFVSFDADGFTIDMGTIEMEDYVPEPELLGVHYRDAERYLNCRCAVLAIRPMETEVRRVGQEAESLASAITDFSGRIERLEEWAQSESWIVRATSRLTLTWLSLRQSARRKRYLTRRWVRATRLWTALMAMAGAWKPLTRKPSKNLSRFRKFRGADGRPWAEYGGLDSSEGKALALAAELFGLDTRDRGVDLQSTIHSEVFYRFDFVEGSIGIRGRFHNRPSYHLCFYFNEPPAMPTADGMIAAALLAASNETDFLLRMVAGRPAEQHQRMLAKMAELPDPTN